MVSLARGGNLKVRRPAVGWEAAIRVLRTMMPPRQITLSARRENV